MKKLKQPYLITAGSLIYYLLLFVGPFLVVVVFSFFRSGAFSAYQPAFTFVNYTRLFTGNVWYLQQIGMTLLLGVGVSLLCLAIAYPLAYFLARTESRFKGLLIMLALIPMLVNMVIRAYGWIILLSPRGLVNSILLNLGVIEEPLRLIFNMTGVVIGFTQILLPFMLLSIMSVLQSIDPHQEQAAQNLGASPFQAFWRITWPLSLPGVYAGLILVFTLTISGLTVPMILGGNVVFTAPVLIWQQFTMSFNWPFASAIATVLMLIVLITLTVFSKLTRIKHVSGEQ